MASIVLLLSELLGGESASVLAADRYIMGGRLSLGREFRPAVTEASAAKQSERPAAGAERAREEEKQRKEESFEDLAVSRIAVDVMWP
ncbi:hypothetical protein SEVIR_5G050700v4 [Setaria viridis]|uniref:Uncharacterized protein n=2 Tax=Setaria TaxID=4554 RepID=K3XSL1_SETIT|nr:uncharacterized protein LOC101771634 [Setaria italica]XP_034597131.1 uncharacterized protein LOC117858215 [Setaria viridis]RCV24020.1 hypothetical protein SETIT_5G051300v2 [Setaria italica]TKW12677.1 hypothetical protein SEVIR_5G050700v2 [Setaria viridis]